MRSTTSLLLLLLLLLVAVPASAQQSAANCAVGPGTGATLLFPYFEVDLANPQGVTTLLSVNNASTQPQLARMVLWTDWAVPTIAYDIYLEPFDIQTINMRSVLNGNLPSTGAGVNLGAFPDCDAFPPDHINPILFPDEIVQLQADHQGLEGTSNSCVGEPMGDQIARGYVTVDVVDQCSGVEGFAPIITPDNASLPYFANGDPAGVAINTNALWGDLIYVDFVSNSAQGSEAVSIWADSNQLSGANTFTFYGRYSGWDGSDNRVPLPDVWSQRFLNGGAFDGGADLLVWRDTGVATEFPFCGNFPTWNPLRADLASLDEDASNITTLGDFAFPVATQRVSVSSLAIPYDFGLLQVATEFSQTWVQPTLAAGGRFSAAFNGTPIVRLCGESPLPNLANVTSDKPALKTFRGQLPSFLDGDLVRGRRPAMTPLSP